MTYASGQEAVNMTLKTGVTVAQAGLILTNDSTNNTVDLTAVSEVGLFISADESNRDAAGDLQTAAGATVSAYPMGGVMLVVATASQTWTTGLPVYATNAGLATTASGSSAKKIGLYVGEGQVVSAVAGATLIRVATAGAAIA
tara:strand:- start:385 stop:813 length:429 start_codon:yes stop_codon:yes gene_type:complete